MTITPSNDFENKAFGERNSLIFEHEGSDTVSELSKRKPNSQDVVSVNDRQFSCNMCDKHYTDRRHLSRHKDSAHEGVRYPCDQCNAGPFADSSGLRRHKASEHEGVRYPCDQCNSGPFSNAAGLWKHKKNST